MDKKFLDALNNQQFASELINVLTDKQKQELDKELKEHDYHQVVYYLYDIYIKKLENKYFNKDEDELLEEIKEEDLEIVKEELASESAISIIEEENKKIEISEEAASNYVSDYLDTKDNSIAKEMIKKNKESKIRNIILKIVTIILLLIWAFMVFLPFYYMVITSFKPFSVYSSEFVPSLLLRVATVDNYVSSFKTVHLAGYMLNTLVFALITTASMIIVSTLAAFGFARINFKGKKLLFTLFLALMMIPTELVVITNYTTIVNVGWRNTLVGLVLPSITSVFYIYLLRENFMLVPDTMYMAAKVDGCSDMRYLLRVLVPINKPTIVSVTILKFIECWNSYIWPRLVTTEEGRYLVSNGIQEIRQNGFGRDNVPAMMAAVVIISIPLIIIYLIFRRQIMAGVVRNGAKG